MTPPNSSLDSRRFLIALVLSIAVIFGVQYLVPGMRPAAKAGADSTVVNGVPRQTAAGPTAAAQVTAPRAITPATPATPGAAAPAIVAETAVVVARRDSGATFRMTNVGAAPSSVVMNAYDNRVHGGKVDLASGGRPILEYQLVTNNTAPVSLATVPFQQTQHGDTLTYQGTVGALPVTISYAIRPDSFTAHVTGTVANAASASYLLVKLPSSFAATEPDTSDDLGSLAYSFLPKHEAARNVLFRSLDPGEKQLVEGPITWIAAKSKYFVVGVLAPKGSAGFTEATLVGGPRVSKVATSASATVVVPIQNGRFAFDLYAGPQEWRRLNALGRDFDQVNPYGWGFVRGLMQPIATLVIRVVLWMHARLHLSYGLVLIALGLLVRLLMWPLYQSSMRTSIKMQVLQPELQAVQDRYKDDPEKQRTEIMKVYQAHGMSPLSPLLGCLPSLLPMPVLFALFFVFRNTIELRGVPFLWLPDLSVRDPYYILPVIMGLSMYLVSWIGMRNTPPNSQAKMMSYMMPVMFTFFFWRAAAGLNLYYATQNLATLPQQWHLAHERTKVQPAVQGTGASASPPRGGGATAPRSKAARS